MTRSRWVRPRLGALCLAGCLLASQGALLAAGDPVRAGAVPATISVEPLQANAVSDRLTAFLVEAVGWTDNPAARAPLGSVRPLIQAAVLAHPEVRLAAEQRSTAGFASREAFAAYLPQVSANIGSGNRKYDAVNKPGSVAPAYTDDAKSAGLTARQLLYDFGATGGRVDAQRAREAAAEARLATRRSELVLRAISAWHEVFRARQQRHLSEVNWQSRQQILAFIEERERLGGSSRSDVLRVQARSADALAALVAADNRQVAAESSYRETFAAAPPAGLTLPEVVALDLARFADARTLIQQNSLVVEALAQNQAAGFDAKSSAAAILPSLHFEVSATRRDIGGPGTPGTDQAVGLVLQHNFYTGGADTARVNQAQQRVVESRLEVDTLQRQLERSLSQTVADARYTEALIAARKGGVQVAAAAYGSVREQFAFRRGTLLDLLQAQEELYIAGRDMIDAVVDHALARYRLLHLAMALTPLFELDTPAPAPIPTPTAPQGSAPP
jgi:adhesin transport system outer membrane protein